MRIRLRRPRWLRRLRGDDDMPPTPARQRLVVALLAVLATLLIGFAMLDPHLAFLRRQAEAAAPKPCAAGQTQGCIGGTMPVIVLPPAAPPAPASR